MGAGEGDTAVLRLPQAPKIACSKYVIICFAKLAEIRQFFQTNLLPANHKKNKL
jgi:hypothetical protein